MTKPLTEAELIFLTGLSSTDLHRLETAGLLKPTDENNRVYRQKLVSWGKKLAYLLQAGWSVAEIKTWSQERWSWPNPRIWPPPKPGTIGDPLKQELPQGRGERMTTPRRG